MIGALVGALIGKGAVDTARQVKSGAGAIKKISDNYKKEKESKVKKANLEKQNNLKKDMKSKLANKGFAPPKTNVPKVKTHYKPKSPVNVMSNEAKIKKVMGL